MVEKIAMNDGDNSAEAGLAEELTEWARRGPFMKTAESEDAGAPPASAAAEATDAPASSTTAPAEAADERAELLRRSERIDTDAPPVETEIQWTEDLLHTAVGHSALARVEGDEDFQRARDEYGRVLPQVEKQVRERDGKLEEIRKDGNLSDLGRKSREQEVRQQFEEQVLRLLAPLPKRTDEHLSEAGLLRMMSDEKPKTPDPGERSEGQLAAGNLLTARGHLDGDEDLVDLVRRAVRYRHPGASALVETAAVALRDPLRVRMLNTLLAADVEPRQQQRLLADSRRLDSAMRVVLRRKLRRRLRQVGNLATRGETRLAQSLLDRGLDS